MNKIQPLDDLEMFELIQAAYPERFKDDNDETWDEAMEFVEQMNGFDDIADLLGRVVMLTMPMCSGFSDKQYHCLGKVTIDNENNNASMVAAVRRDL
jgi:hypothetical protein